MTHGLPIAVLMILQAICAGFLLFDIVTSLLGLPVGPISWQLYEILEIGAAIGLIFGFVLCVVVVRRSMRENERVRSQLRAASGAFMDLLEDSFRSWKLTPAERDVALFSIKGLSIQEIATIRQTSEGTVKAQTNAIYRKAGVSGRPQLLSLFIDDLMEGGLATEPCDTALNAGHQQ